MMNRLGSRRHVSGEHLRRCSLNFPYQPLYETGEKQGRIAMRISEQAGSAALHLRLPAFGGLCSTLYYVLGFEPVTAVTLALVSTIVLAWV